MGVIILKKGKGRCNMILHRTLNVTSLPIDNMNQRYELQKLIALLETGINP